MMNPFTNELRISYLLLQYQEILKRGTNINRLTNVLSLIPGIYVWMLIKKTIQGCEQKILLIEMPWQNLYLQVEREKKLFTFVGKSTQPMSIEEFLTQPSTVLRKRESLLKLILLSNPLRPSNMLPLIRLHTITQRANSSSNLLHQYHTRKSSRVKYSHSWNRWVTMSKHSAPKM